MDNDHDLLIQIATKLDRAILDIKELKDNTTARVTALEEEKATHAEVAALVKRVSYVEKLAYIGFGIVLCVELYIIYIH